MKDLVTAMLWAQFKVLGQLTAYRRIGKLDPVVAIDNKEIVFDTANNIVQAKVEGFSLSRSMNLRVHVSPRLSDPGPIGGRLQTTNAHSLKETRNMPTN
jgi:hypothetical protein